MEKRISVYSKFAYTYKLREALMYQYEPSAMRLTENEPPRWLATIYLRWTHLNVIHWATVLRQAKSLFLQRLV